MAFMKQIFATVFFFKILEITFDFIGMDSLLFSNEEVAIAILFYLFVLNVKKSFGMNILKALLEKGEYLVYLHERFSKEKYMYLESKKENLGKIKKIETDFSFEKSVFGFEKIKHFLQKKTREKVLYQFYQMELSQVQNISRQNADLENVSLLKDMIGRVFLSLFLLKK